MLRGERQRCKTLRVTRPAMKQEPFLPQTPAPADPMHSVHARHGLGAVAWSSVECQLCCCVSRVPQPGQQVGTGGSHPSELRPFLLACSPPQGSQTQGSEAQEERAAWGQHHTAVWSAACS